MNGQRWRYLYWALPPLLALVQLAFSRHATPELRYEELAESVRNVYWLEHRTVYDGVSSNVGWYGLLLLCYRLFGFHLYAAQSIRVALSLVSLLALAATLRRYLRAEHAWLPLILFGLSPTLLFFNTLQTSYGTDLQYAPIALFLVLGVRFSSRPGGPEGLRSAAWFDAAGHALLGLVAIVASASYPTFLFYLPVLGAIYYDRMRAEEIAGPRVIRPVLALAGGFFLPLAGVVVAMKDPRLLLFDPRVHAGLFRGSGYLSPRPRNAAKNLIGSAADLFGRAHSYYYEVARTEFSDWLPLVALVAIALVSIRLARASEHDRRPFGLALALIVITLAATVMAVDPSGQPGMRRVTPLLAAVYACCAIAWQRVNGATTAPRAQRLTVAVGLLVLLLHHVLVLPLNYRRLPAPSVERYALFFDSAGTPAQSLAQFLKAAVDHDLQLRCPDPEDCRYAEIYAAVAGSCLWNRLPCHQLSAFDDATHRFIPLSPSLWETYYWNH